MQLSAIIKLAACCKVPRMVPGTSSRQGAGQYLTPRLDLTCLHIPSTSYFNLMCLSMDQHGCPTFIIYIGIFLCNVNNIQKQSFNVDHNVVACIFVSVFFSFFVGNSFFVSLQQIHSGQSSLIFCMTSPNKYWSTSLIKSSCYIHIHCI